MEQMKCKWISDDFSEICTNVDCDYLADFCPCTEFPAVCRHSELAEEDKDVNQCWPMTANAEFARNTVHMTKIAVFIALNVH